MKKKILVFVIALTAFLAGSTFVYIGTNKNTVKMEVNQDHIIAVVIV